MDIYPKRIERFKEVVARRQYDLTLVLENVHDPHNIGAVLRTSDSVGIGEIYVVYSDPRLQKRGLEIGHTSASGAKQWINIHYFEDVKTCFEAVRKKYNNIFGTKLDERAVSVYDLALENSCALVFGNEHEGLSSEACTFLDGNFMIPQHGFTKSLNISVACAVSVYEAQRQRLKAGKYDRCFGDHQEDGKLFDEYVEIHNQKKLPYHLKKKED